MKKVFCVYFLPLLLTLLVPLLAFGQISISGDLSGLKRKGKEDFYDTAKYKVFYEVKMAKESKDPTSVHAGQGILLIGDKAVSFQDYIKYRCDSLLYDPASDERSNAEIMNAALSFGMTLFRYQVVILPGKQKALHQTQEVAFSEYRYEENLPDYMWRKEPETKEIAGYLCHRATCDFRGRSYEAWYAEDIPFPYGPYKFGGLPGLIMELSDSTGDYHYSFAGMEQVKKHHEGRIHLSAGSRLQISSRDEVRQIIRNYNEDPFKLIETKVKTDQNEARPKKKKPYNPIELE